MGPKKRNENGGLTLKLWKRIFIFGASIILEKLMIDQLRNACKPGIVGGFLSGIISWQMSFTFFKLQNFIFFEGVKQIANVTALSWIVGKSVRLPDILSGYGNYVGNLFILLSRICLC